MVKNRPANAGATGVAGSISGSPMERGAWQATVHEVTKESDMTWQVNNSLECRVSVPRPEIGPTALH